MFGIWDRLVAEVRVIRSAPLSFIVFLLCGGVLGYLTSNWYYGKQIVDKDSQISRYRVALGIDKATSALAELTNQELQAKALNSASKIRDLCYAFKKQEDQIQPPTKGNKFEEKQHYDAVTDLRKEIGEEFDRNLRSDFLNSENEVMRRLDTNTISAAIRQPFIVDATTGAPTALASIRPPEREALDLCTDAEQLEQLAKLLPTSGGK